MANSTRIDREQRLSHRPKPGSGEGREEASTEYGYFSSLVREYAGMVYSLAHRILGSEEDAKDVVQETFTKIYDHLDEISEGCNPKNWIYTIGLNKARDAYRRNTRHIEVNITEQLESQNPAFDINTVDNNRFAHLVLAALPIELKEVMVLFYLEERSVIEISDLLKISESLVKVRLHRARQKVLKTFGDQM